MTIQLDQEQIAKRQDVLQDSLNSYDVEHAYAALYDVSPSSSEVPLNLRQVFGAYQESLGNGAVFSQVLKEKIEEENSTTYVFDIEIDGWPSRNLEMHNKSILEQQQELLRDLVTAELSRYIVDFNKMRNDGARGGHLMKIVNDQETINNATIDWRSIQKGDPRTRITPSKLHEEEQEVLEILKDHKHLRDAVTGGVELNSPPGTGKSLFTKLIEENLDIFQWIAPEKANRLSASHLNKIKYRALVIVPKDGNQALVATDLFGGNTKMNVKFEDGKQRVIGFHPVGDYNFPGAQTPGFNPKQIQRLINNQIAAYIPSHFEVLLSYAQTSVARDFWTNSMLYARAQSNLGDEFVQPLSTGGMLQTLAFVSAHMGLDTVPDQWLELLDCLPYQPAIRLGFAPPPEKWVEHVIKDANPKRLAVLEAGNKLTAIYADLAEKGLITLTDPYNEDDKSSVVKLLSHLKTNIDMQEALSFMIEDLHLFLRAQRAFSHKYPANQVPRAQVIDSQYEDLLRAEVQLGWGLKVDFVNEVKAGNAQWNMMEEASDFLNVFISRAKPDDILSVLNGPRGEEFTIMLGDIIELSLRNALDLAKKQLSPIHSILKEYRQIDPKIAAQLFSLVHPIPELDLKIQNAITQDQNKVPIDLSQIAENLELIKQILIKTKPHVKTYLSDWNEIFINSTIPALEIILGDKRVMKALNLSSNEA